MSKHININDLIRLASFEVTEEEKKQLKAEIDDFLAYAEIINQAECDHLLPASHSIEKQAFIRDDKTVKWEYLHALFMNAPVKEESSYLVPPQKGRVGRESPEKPVSSISKQSKQYEAVIGLEVHAQLKTKTKLFCSCATEFGNNANHNTCPVCSGQPGVLPVLNKEAVHMAIKAGLATHSTINQRSVFERKNYFYPDLPKGYQISQLEEPICSKGWVEIETGNGTKKVRLNRIHMEEDAGKMVHVGAPGIWGSKASAVDFNRSSVPLIEIVTEPDLSSARQAKEYVMMLRTILVNLGICDGNLEEGSLRCDANISLREKGKTSLGIKTEVKNMNSFKAIEKAIDFEIDRQLKLLQSGLVIEQETRLWDEASQKTYTLRSKEDSHDYRYFPDPDLLPLILEKGLVEQLKNDLPEAPLVKKARLIEHYGLMEEQALILLAHPIQAAFFEAVLTAYDQYKTAVNWFFNELLSYADDFSQLPFTASDFVWFLKQIDQEMISGKMGKQVLKFAFLENKSLNTVIEEKGWQQITDRGQITALVEQVLSSHQEQVAQYRQGKKQVYAYLVGQVMKISQGKANPQLVNAILTEKLK